MKHHAGILDEFPEWDRFQLIILVNTPGIPLEWIYAGLGVKEVRRRHLRGMVDATGTSEWSDAGRRNAEGISHADGWRMLEVVCPGYSGPVPLWSQIALRNDTRSDSAIARVLGVDRKKVGRWRKNTVFDPLTGVRVRPNRGTPMGTWEY